MTKIHLGCGKRNFGSDWIHIDGGDFPHVIHHDITTLPFDDNSVDVLYASHLIAYFDREEIVKVFEEWNRVLKKGGVLRLATPDFEAMITLYKEGKIRLENILGPMYGKMEMRNKTIYHKTTYDFIGLATLLHDIGFSIVHLYDWRKTEHSHIDDHSQAFLPHMDKDNGKLISLNIECIK